MTLPKTSRQWHLLGPEQIELLQVELPTPRAGELLLRVDAATTCGTDLKVFRRGGHPRMLRPPCPFGHELAGEVVASGPQQGRWPLGQRLVVANSAACGECLPCRRGRENLCTDLLYLNGAFAEHLLLPERFVQRSSYPAPVGVPVRLAALAEPLACAVHCGSLLEPFVAAIEHAGPPTALIYGAGPLGLLLAGVLSLRGLRVVCADPHPERLEIAAALGSVHCVVLDGRGGQASSVLSRSAEALRGQAAFDVALDASGTREGWLDAMASVAPGGKVVFFGGTAAGVEIPVDTQWLHYSETSLHGVYHHRPGSFQRALELLAAGDLPFERLLSETRPLEELPQALERMAKREVVKVALSAW